MIGGLALSEGTIGESPLAAFVAGSATVVASAAASFQTGAVIRGAGFIGYRHDVSLAISGAASLFANADFRLLLATEDYATWPTDSLANRQFLGTLIVPLSFERSLLTGGSIGDVTAAWGEVEAENSDGGYDYLVRDYTINGRRITMRMGDAEAAHDTHAVIFDGVGVSWQVTEQRLRIRVRDFAYRLEKALQQGTYPGTGGLGGGADLAGKRIPLAFGPCDNVTPALVIPNELLFQVHDGAVQDTVMVYVRGAALAKGADYPDAAALRAATIPSGSFATCNAAGLFRINFLLEGEVTADVQGDKTGGTYATTTAGIVQRIAGRMGETSFDTAAFVAVTSAQPATVCYYLGVDDGATAQDVIAGLMRGVGGWAGHKRDGSYSIGILRLPTGNPVQAFTPIEITEIDRDPLPDAVNPPNWRRRMAWGRNWTVQSSDLAGSVRENPDRMAYLKEAFRVAEATNAIKADFPEATDPDVIEGYFAHEDDAGTEAARQLAIWGGERSLYRMKLKTQPFSLDLGDEVASTYPRWDLLTGKALVTVYLRENAEDNEVELVGLG